MKPGLMEILVCPECKGSLELTVDKQDGDEIVEGSLKCQQCGEVYPIQDTIPNMLPRELREEAGS